jgi:hypothetical protein
VSLVRPGRAARRAIGRLAFRVVLSEHAPAFPWRQLARLAAGTPAAADAGLRQLSPKRLLELAEDPSQRALVTGALSAHVLLDLGAAHTDLSPAVLECLRKAPDDLASALYEAIVLDRAGDPQRLTLALIAASQAHDLLAVNEERSLLARCIELIGRGSNPYDAVGTGIAGPARQAASAIVARRPDLDEILIAELADMTKRPALMGIAAAALQERPSEAGKRFTAYVTALHLPREQLIRFAEDCDSSREWRLEVATKARDRMLTAGRQMVRDWIGPYLRLAFAAVGVPAAAGAGAFFAARHVHGSLATVSADPTVAIGALALLAAVHVLSVQLAAQRLPGPIATATALPPLMFGGYLTGVGMLVLSLLGREKPPASWNPGLLATFLLIVFVLVIVTTVSRSLRATSLAAATEAAGRRYIRRARRTGKRAGRLHRNARDFQEAIDRHNSLRRFTSPHETGLRYPIRADSTGFLSVRMRRLRRLAEHPALTSARARLDLTASPGVPVSEGTEVAALVPLGTEALDAALVSQAHRIFSVRQERDLELFAELCVSLTTQLAPLTRAGDPGAANRLLRVLLRLLDDHTAADAEERGDYKDLLPLSPAVQQVIGQAAASLAEAERPPEREVLTRLLEGLIALSRGDDGILTLVTMNVRQGARDLTDYGVLYDAGCHAANLDARLSLQQAQDALHKLVGGTTDQERYANEVAGRLVTYCATAAPTASRVTWSRWWQAAALTPIQDRVRIALRIGAAALPVGNLSLATEVSVALADQDFAALRARIHEREMSAFENLLSELYGRLLGADAEARIADFIDFAEAVTVSIPPAPPAAPAA